jgi:E3 ubiquitin-protein ligase ATL6/9/15/31/42/55
MDTPKCAICTEELKEDSTAIACGHVFHIRCIDEWFAKKMTCPVCRSDLDPDKGSERAEEEDMVSEVISNLVALSMEGDVAFRVMFRIQ